MVDNWTTIKEVSELEAVKELRSMLKAPSAIVLLSGNDMTMELAATELGQMLGVFPYEIHEFSGLDSLRTFPKQIFATNQYIIVSLIRGASTSHEFRHEAIRTLRNAGAKEVAVIWIKGNPERDNHTATMVNDALRRDPPTADGIEHFFTVKI